MISPGLKCLLPTLWTILTVCPTVLPELGRGLRKTKGKTGCVNVQGCRKTSLRSGYRRGGSAVKGFIGLVEDPGSSLRTYIR